MPRREAFPATVLSRWDELAGRIAHGAGSGEGQGFAACAGDGFAEPGQGQVVGGGCGEHVTIAVA
jgi:hypothetical protein